MGLREWTAKRKIKDPVRGMFSRAGWYDKHGTTWLTGAITVQGMPAFPAEARADSQGKWTQTHQLPVVVDRSNPNNFAILWEEIVLQGPGAQAQQSAQQEAARLNAGAAPGAGTPFGNPMGVPGLSGAPAAFPGTGNPTDAQAWARELMQESRELMQQFETGGLTAGSVTSQVFVNGQPVAPGTESPMVADALRRAAERLGQVGSAFPNAAAAPASLIPTTATVLSVTDVASSAPGGSADVTFDVAVPEGSRQVSQRVSFMTPDQRAAVQLGKALPVLLDPATGFLRPDPSRQT